VWGVAAAKGVTGSAAPGAGVTGGMDDGVRGGTDVIGVDAYADGVNGVVGTALGVFAVLAPGVYGSADGVNGFAEAGVRS
jgi:hypothetical protein